MKTGVKGRKDGDERWEGGRRVIEGREEKRGWYKQVSAKDGGWETKLRWKIDRRQRD